MMKTPVLRQQCTQQQSERGGHVEEIEYPTGAGNEPVDCPRRARVGCRLRPDRHQVDEGKRLPDVTGPDDVTP